MDLEKRDINQLVFDLAEYGNRARDVQELYRRLGSMKLFAKVVYANTSPLPEGRHVVQKGETIKLLAATLPGGQRMARFHVDKSDPRLQPDFVGVSAREAFEMVLATEQLDGLMLCNPRDSWFAMLKEEIERLLRAGTV